MIVKLTRTKSGVVVNSYDRMTRKTGSRLKTFKGEGAWSRAYAYALAKVQHSLYIEPLDCTSEGEG